MRKKHVHWFALTIVFLISGRAYAGACLEAEADWIVCIRTPDQCTIRHGYYDNANPWMQFPPWFEAIPSSKRLPLNRFIAALSCYPVNQWNLGNGLYGLSRKASMLTRIRYDHATRVFLERHLIPQLQQYPALLNSPIIRYYLLAMRHPLAKQLKEQTPAERAIFGDPSVLAQLESDLTLHPSHCDALSLLFLAQPTRAIQFAEAHRLNCYESAEGTVALMKRVLNRMYGGGYPKPAHYDGHTTPIASEGTCRSSRLGSRGTDVGRACARQRSVSSAELLHRGITCRRALDPPTRGTTPNRCSHQTVSDSRTRPRVPYFVVVETVKKDSARLRLPI